MAGLAVQNFVSAAVGIAVLVAFIRGLAARSGRELGNFYVDLIRDARSTSCSRSRSSSACSSSPRACSRRSASPTCTRSPARADARAGPVASQEAIKQLGTNGGGFFNVNSAMPFENPTWLSNFVEMLLILLIPAALTATYGRMVGNRRQGWAIFAAMMSLFVVARRDRLRSPSPRRRPRCTPPASPAPTWRARSSASASPRRALFVGVTTAASCGAVNAAMESLTGIGGAVPMAR